MKGIDFKNIDFKNITPEQKKKFFVGGGLLLVVAGFIYISVPKDEDQKTDDYNLPHNSEVENYNSKTDALNKSSVKSSNDDLEGMYKNDSVKTETINFNDLDKQLSEASLNTQQTKIQPSQNNTIPQNNTTASNAHNVYGDYDMWQQREPANSKIGYSKKNNSNSGGTAPHKNPIPQQTYAEPDIPQQQISIPKVSYQEKQNFSNNQIQAKLLTTGKAVNGTQLTFVLLEPAKFAGVETKKGQTIQGIAKEENGRLLINIQTIKINSKIYPVNVKLLGEDGIEGIAINGGTGNRSNVGETARNVGGDIAGGVVSSIPIVGGALSNVVRKRQSGGQEPINLSSNIRAIIMIY
ncbi:hypothetical protein CMT22_17800 [Elizabethkingia anophelis]|nr:hypothetical protein [Elizabethkingia anophelis]